MKDFLIGLTIGIVAGACLIKSNKDLSKAVDKSKQMVEETVEKGKDFVQENIIKPTKKNSSK